METLESRIIEFLKTRDGKWTGLHVIASMFDFDYWGQVEGALELLVSEGVIEKHFYPPQRMKDGKMQPAGFTLFRYVPPVKPQLTVVK